MKTIIRRVITLAIVALVLGGGYFLGSRYLWPAPDARTIQTVGIIEAPEVNITSRIAGRIVQLDLLEGDTVERGQVVCRTEDVDIKNQLAKARGDLANASADLRNAEYGEAGTILGGMFIAEFAGGKPWAHIDIAASAWNTNLELTTVLHGPSGAGTRLCIELAELMARGGTDSWPPAPRNA